MAEWEDAAGIRIIRMVGMGRRSLRKAWPHNSNQSILIITNVTREMSP